MTLSKTRLKSLIFLAIFCIYSTSILAEDFMQEARGFLNTPNASVEQNQEYIAESNQFTIEGDFTNEQLAELFLIRAIIFIRLNDNENALDSFSESLNGDYLPPILKAEAYKQRGLLQYTSGSYGLAKADFANALGILSGNAELHYYLANSHFGLFEFERAIMQYNLALEGMAANRFLAYYGKASVYYQQEQYAKARENLTQSLAVRTDFEPATSLLAEINALDNQPDQQSSQPAQNLTANENSELTANEIYNQLLQQALAAQKNDGNGKPVSIKLNLDDAKRQAALPKTSNNNEPTSSKAIRISALPIKPLPQPLPNEPKQLPEALQQTSTNKKQVSANPFIIGQDQQSNRLDSLLNDGQEIELTGFFLQLISGKSKPLVEEYYAQLVKKHELLLAQRPYVIRPFTDAKNRLTYQLLISGFESYKQANSLCKFLKAQNSQCFVRQLK